MDKFTELVEYISSIDRFVSKTIYLYCFFYC